MREKIKQFDKKQACLFGHMVGDIIGAGFEFKTPNQIKKSVVLNPKTNEAHTYVNYAGLYTDDFSQTLCLNTCIKDSILDFDQEMLAWNNGKYWATGELFDIGNQTSHALLYYSKNGKYRKSSERESGNGGLMRVAPLAFIDGNILHNVKAYSSITHNNSMCFDSGVFYIRLLKNVVDFRDKESSFIDVWNTTCDEGVVPPDSHIHKLGSGYVVDTINTIKHVMDKATSYQDAIVLAIQYGGDTDTNAAVVGSVAALWFGLDSIPDEWLEYIQPSLQNEYAKKLFNL
jgi:ADP-ribosylglycohydrolase